MNDPGQPSSTRVIGVLGLAIAGIILGACSGSDRSRRGLTGPRLPFRRR